MKPRDTLRLNLSNAGGIYIDGDETGFRWKLGSLLVIASWGMGWDHASVSAGWGPNGATRVPTYAELESVRRLFWEDHETVIQIHPPIARYVNRHPYVLHLWRSQTTEVELPPQGLIA